MLYRPTHVLKDDATLRWRVGSAAKRDTAVLTASSRINTGAGLAGSAMSEAASLPSSTSRSTP
ncbi:hypothetical protein SAMN05192544_104285 [Paraburkholderia hospita]|nr:hypothetical protein SAMN05192544_104285 [Paraburkholderia hospita]